MEDVQELLRLLAEADIAAAAGQEGPLNIELQLADVDVLQATAARQDCNLWADRTISSLAASIGRSLSKLLRSTDKLQACLAAAAFGALIGLPDAPVFRLLDAISCEGLLNTVGSVFRGRYAGCGEQQNGEFDQVEQECSDQELLLRLSSDAIAGLARCLAVHSLCDQPDMRRSIAETMAEVARAPLTPPATSSSAYSAMLSLCSSRHGDVAECSTFVMRFMTLALLGLGSTNSRNASRAFKTSAIAPSKHATTSCRAARAFVLQLMRTSSEVHASAAALARHLVMRAPDKAEFRAIATESAALLVDDLPLALQQEFCVFVCRLSRTAKVSQRYIAVDLVSRLLSLLPAPYIMPAEVDAQRVLEAGTPVHHRLRAVQEGCTPDGAVSAKALGADANCSVLSPAPSGVACLTALLQRCSDKSALVRARAVTNLGTVVGEQLSNSNDDSVISFRKALAAAVMVRMQHIDGLIATPATAMPVVDSPDGLHESGATPIRDTTATRCSPLGRIEHMDSAGSLHGVSRLVVGLESRGRGWDRSRNLARVAASNAATAMTARSLDIEFVVRMARRRAGDEKGMVRRAAVVLLEAVLRLRAVLPDGLRSLPTVRPPTATDLEAIRLAARDPLVSVRKAALTAAVALLGAMRTQAAVACLWVDVVLPLVCDGETSVQECALDHLHADLLEPASAASTTDRHGQPTPKALAAIEALRQLIAHIPAAATRATGCLRKACMMLAAKKRLPAKAAAAGLQLVIQGNGFERSGNSEAEIAGAWLLLADIAACEPNAPSWEFLQEEWQNMKRCGRSGTSSSCRLLLIIACAASRFPPEQAPALSTELQQAVVTFALPAAAVGAHLKAISQLQPTDETAAQRWSHQVLAAAEKLLSTYVASGGCVGDSSDQQAINGSTSTSDMTAAQDAVAAAIFAIGEVALLQGGPARASVVTLVQALTAEQLLPPADAADPMGPGSNQQSTTIPAPLQAHAWTALGKLCLANEPIAKSCVPHFVRHLRSAAHPAVRINISIALADMCITYTGLVDAHVPKLAACLCDDHEVVRRQTLALLAHLLQKDFVKWRGALFQRFLLALVDDSVPIRSLAEYLLTDTLATKAPLLAYNHFVEAMFTLNGYHDGLPAHSDDYSSQPSWQAVESSSADTSGPAPAVRAKRDTIYRALLGKMAPEHKFATAARLTAEVLAAVGEGSLPLAACSEVLSDALRVLASPAIKVSGRGSAVASSADEEGEAPGAAATHAAKQRVVAAMFSRHLTSAFLPAAVQLRQLLLAKCSPLVGDLMACLASLLADHAAEIPSMLAAHPDLAAELLFDIRAAAAAKKTAAAAARNYRHSTAAHASRPGHSIGGGHYGTPPSSLQNSARGDLPVLQRQGHGTPGSRQPSGVLPDTPAAAAVLEEAASASRSHGRSPCSPTRFSAARDWSRSGGRASIGVNTAQLSTPTPMPTTSTPGSAGMPAGTPVTIPRLQEAASKGISAVAEACGGESDAAVHVTVTCPTTEAAPWRIAASALGDMHLCNRDLSSGPPSPKVLQPCTNSRRSSRHIAPRSCGIASNEMPDANSKQSTRRSRASSARGDKKRKTAC